MAAQQDYPLRHETVTMNDVQWNIVLLCMDFMHKEIGNDTLNVKIVRDELFRQLGRESNVANES